MKNYSRIKEMIKELNSMLDDGDGEETQGQPPTGPALKSKENQLGGDDFDDGGSDGVTDMSPELDMPSDAQLEPKKKRKLDIIVASMKKRLGK